VKNCYLAIFSFPRKFYARVKTSEFLENPKVLEFCRFIKYASDPAGAQLSQAASQDLCLKNLSFCGFFLVICCTHQMV